MSAKLEAVWVLLNQRIDSLNQRVTTIEAREAAQTFDELTQTTLADAVASAPAGVAVRYVTDGLREGGGVGVISYFDPGSSTWRRISDNGAVTT